MVVILKGKKDSVVKGSQKRGCIGLKHVFIEV